MLGYLGSGTAKIFLLCLATSVLGQQCPAQINQWGHYCVRGLRPHMEDRYISQLSSNYSSSTWFGVFDGHAGDAASIFLKNRIMTLVDFEISQLLHKQSTFETAKAVFDGIREADEVFLRRYPKKIDGSTLVMVGVFQSGLLVANVGDSRAIVVSEGRVTMATIDHKPNLPEERARIESVGGFVQWNRVMGNLALSRAIGDRWYKNTNFQRKGKMVIADADMYWTERSGERETLVIASDGLWDVWENHEVASFLNQRKEADAKEVARELVNIALERGSTDNVCVVLLTTQ